MTVYPFTTEGEVSPEAVALAHYAVYDGRKDEKPGIGYIRSGEKSALIVTEGRLPYPDHQTPDSQRKIVLEVSVKDGNTTSKSLATSFNVEEGSEMVKPENLPGMIAKVQTLLRGGK